MYRLRSWARAQWRAAVALTAVVVIAGGGSLVLVAGAARTLTAPDRYSSWRGAVYDVSIEQAHGPPQTAALEALPATGRVDMATFVFGGLFAEGSDEPLEGLVFAGRQAGVGGLLVDGREPDPDRPGEFVASRAFVASVGAQLGDEFDVRTFTQRQADEAGFDAGSPEGPSLTATLVGVMDATGELEGFPDLLVFPSTLLDEGDVGVAASVGLAALAPGATIADLRAQLDELPDGEIFSLSPAEWVSSDVRAGVNAQGQGLLVLGLIVAVAALVVLGQVLSRQLRPPDTEQIVLPALGFSRGHVVGDTLSRSAAIVLPGAAGALVLAYLCSGLFPVGFVDRVEPHPGLRFDATVLGVATAAVPAALLGWVVVARLVELRPSRTPRPWGFAEVLASALPGGQASTGLRFAFVPATGRARSATTPVVGLTLVFCVLFGALTFGTNMRRLVSQPAQWGHNQDFDIGAGETEISPEIQAALEASPDVGGFTLYGTTAVAVGTRSLDVVGMRQVKGDLVPEVLDGRLPAGKGEIALGSIAARDLGVEVGDPLELDAASGERTLAVVGLALVYTASGADELGKSGLVAEGGLLSLDPSATMNTGAIQLAPGAPPGAAERLEALTGSSIGRADRPPAIVNLHRVRNIPTLVAAVVGVLAMLSLGHLMIVAVRRRRTDHAILRALGASPRWVIGVVHWQATIMTTLVVLLAVPIGAAVGRVHSRELTDSVGARDDTVVPVLVLGAAAVGVIALANLAAAIPGRRSRADAPTRMLTEAPR